MKRLSVIILTLLALAMPAQAQSTWATPQTATGGPTVTGGVGLCVNGSGLAVPCGASTPAYVYPGTGATWNIGTGGLGTPSTPLSVAGVVGGTPVPVTGTFSATLGGFAPSGNYATLAVTTSTGNVALPAGSPAVVVVYNTGSNPVYVKLGTSNAVTATTGDDYIPAGGAMALTVGSNTYLAAISTGGSTSINLSGGSGLATGWGGGSGGGGSGGGGTVTQGTAASSGPWIFTPWIAGAVNSPTNGLYANLLQGNAVISSGNPLFAQLTAGAAKIGVVTTDQTTPGASDLVHAAQNGIWTVTQGTAASSGPWIFTPWVAGAVNSPTNGLYANLLQGNAVNASGNPIFAQLTAGAVTIGNVNQTAVTAGFSKITDGTNGPAAVKAASTAAAATDPALVVSISPNSPVNVANQSVGSAAFATAQASPGISATSIVAARTGAPGTGRIAAIIVNMSTVPVFLGGSGVTAATGSYLAGVVGAAVVIPTTAAIYGITASGTGSVSVQELY